MSERNTLRTRQDFCPERRSEGISRARSQSVWAGPSERQALARTAVCQKVPWLGVEGPGGWRTVAVPRQAVGREARRGPQRTVEGRGSLWQSGTCLRGSGLGVHVTLKSAWVCVRPRSGQAGRGMRLSPPPRCLFAAGLVPWEVGRAAQTWGPVTWAGRASAFCRESCSFDAVPTIFLTPTATIPNLSGSQVRWQLLRGA